LGRPSLRKRFGARQSDTGCRPSEARSASDVRKPLASTTPRFSDNQQLPISSSVGSNSPDLAIGQQVVKAWQRGQGYPGSPRTGIRLSASGRSCQYSPANVKIFTTYAQTCSRILREFIGNSSGPANVLPRRSLLRGRINGEIGARHQAEYNHDSHQSYLSSYGRDS
jgi:hypothetical protein